MNPNLDYDKLLMMIQDDAGMGNLRQISRKSNDFLLPHEGNLLSARDAQRLMAKQLMQQQQQAQQPEESGDPLWQKQERADDDRMAMLNQMSADNEAWRAQNITGPTGEGTVSGGPSGFNPSGGIPYQRSEASAAGNEARAAAAAPGGISVGPSDNEAAMQEMLAGQRQHDIDLAKAKGDKGEPNQTAIGTARIGALATLIKATGGNMDLSELLKIVDQEFGSDRSGAQEAHAYFSSQPTTTGQPFGPTQEEDLTSQLQQVISDPMQLQRALTLPREQQLQIIEAAAGQLPQR